MVPRGRGRIGCASHRSNGQHNVDSRGRFSAERGLGALALADLSIQTRVLKHGFGRWRRVVLNSPAWSDQKGKGKKDESKETVEMAAAAKVTIDQAIKSASEKVAGKVVEAELEMNHDTLVWEVEVVTAENKVMEVHIDAESGAVIDVEEEKLENDMKSEQKQGRKQQNKP